MSRAAVVPGLRFFFALLMLAAAAGKLADMAGFFGIVAAYRALPVWLVPIAAWAMALTELALGAWLLTARAPGAAALTLIGIHLVYLLWLVAALLRGIPIDNCGCFGVYLGRPLTPYTLLEDLALLGLAAGWWLRIRRRAGERCR